MENSNLKEFWSGHVESWNNDSKSQTRYCKENNLSAHQFSYWKRKLNKIQENNSEFIEVPVLPVKRPVIELRLFDNFDLHFSLEITGDKIRTLFQ